MGLGIGLGSAFDYFRQYNVIRRIGIRRNGAEPIYKTLHTKIKKLIYKYIRQQFNFCLSSSTLYTLDWRMVYISYNICILCKILSMSQDFDEFTLKKVCPSAVNTSSPTLMFYRVV